MEMYTHLSPRPMMNHSSSTSFYSPRDSRAFSLKSNTSVPQHVPYIISDHETETHSEISSPIVDEHDEMTLRDVDVDVNCTNTNALTTAKPNVYSPIGRDLWNEDEIDDLPHEMSQQFARLTKRLSVDSIHSFKTNRRTLIHSNLSHEEEHVIEDEYDLHDVLLEDDDEKSTTEQTVS